MVYFFLILYIETFTVAIEILEIEAKILKQVGKIFFVSLSFIDCRICYHLIFKKTPYF